MNSINNKYAKLILVSGEANSNKYYELIGTGTTITVNYGRVESTKVTITKPINQWDQIIKEKLKKGYKDVTHTVSVKQDVKPTIAPISNTGDNLIDQFLNKMKAYTDGLVAKTYSVKAVNVTQAQVDEAQSILDSLNTKKLKDPEVNKKLIELYTVIPRYMSHVKNYLLPSIKLENILGQEQNNLDAMASQVAMIKPKKKVKKDKNTLLDILGITMKETKSNKEIDYLITQINSTSKKIKGIFEVNKSEEDKVYNEWLNKQTNKSSKILIHGTKCTSVIPILEIGLKIRPQGNFQFSGKVYGDGNYFSEVVQKSLGYTGYDQDSVLLVYEVHTGNPFVYDGWYKGNSFSLNYTELNKRGFDSTYVKAGNGLLNSEIIAYKEQQNKIKYIIWLEK